VFRIWFVIGIQSFGGGVATLSLIRQAAVLREKWITDEQFVSDWALCQITPGINLLACAILLGRRTNGFLGALLALMGLLLPSAAVTILMTALYHHVEGAPVTQKLLRGLIPASIGLGFVTAVHMGRPLVRAGFKEGSWMGLLGLGLLVSSGAVMTLQSAPSVVEVLAGAGVVFAVANLAYERSRTPA
jgi:chromate transporter